MIILQASTIGQMSDNNEGIIQLENIPSNPSVNQETSGTKIKPLNQENQEDGELQLGQWDYLAIAALDGILIALAPLSFSGVWAFQIAEALTIVVLSISFILFRKIFTYTPLNFTSYSQIASILFGSSFLIYLLIVLTMLLLYVLTSDQTKVYYGKLTMFMCPLTAHILK